MEVKIMKTLKRTLSLALCLAMVAAFCVTALAAMVDVEITYDANGGSNPPAATTGSYNDAGAFSAALTVATGTTMVPPALKKFKEWNTANDGTGESFDAGDSATVGLVFYADPPNPIRYGTPLELYAIWEDLDTYTVTYDANGGGGTQTAGTAYEDTPFTLPATTFTAPVGKVFGGWAATAAGTALTSPYAHSNAAFTLYALWIDPPPFDGYVPSTAKFAADITILLHTNDTTLVAPPVPANAANVKLNLATEKLESGAGTAAFEIAGYSIGGKWKAGAPDDAVIKKFFDKGGVLAVTDKMAAKAKDGASKGTKGVVGVPAAGTTPAVEEVLGEAPGYVITFTKVEARPKALKLDVNYIKYAKDDGSSYGNWTISEKKKTDEYDVAKVQYLKPADNKKPADGEVYGSFPVGAGIPILDKGYGDKVGGKSVYYIQQIAYASTDATPKYVPATKASKVSVAAAQKAPKLKPDYKKDNIKVKAGVAIDLDDGDGFTLYAKSADTVRGVLAVPAKGKEPVLTAGPITVFTFASAKKPASLKQTINIAPAAATPAATAAVSFDNGKIIFAEGIEAAATDPAAATFNGKWGKVKVTVKTSGTTEVWVRVKSTAKVVKPGEDNVTGFEGNKASAFAKVTITWGKDAENNPTATFA
jgi:hypothetical protein